MASVSRRAALAVPSCLLTGVASAAPAPLANPDAALIALCGRYMSLERRQTRLFNLECEAQEAEDTELVRWLAAVQRRYVPYGHTLRDSIAALPAKTQTGLVAKAWVCMTMVSRDSDGDPSWEHYPLWSLCHDLLGCDPGEGAA